MLADVQGSLEAIENVLHALPNHEVAIKIIQSGVGAVTESDVDFASTGKASIYAFNVPIATKVKMAAKQAHVNISSHSVIYTVVDKAKEGMSDLLEPEIIHSVEGEASIQQLFSITIKKKQETIAGCRVLSGKLMRNQLVRIIRDGKMVHEGTIKTFKHHKKDILEAAKGLECGINIEDFDDVQAGDILQSVNVITKKRTID
jgi:translation initiation factor IF-2